MNIVVTGGTGFVGKSLTQRLLRDGHRLTLLVRDLNRARSNLGAETHLLPWSASDDDKTAVLNRADAVVNLAGENILGGRWTTIRKRALIDSRVQTTRNLISLMARATHRPRAFLSASAVGFYGDRGDEELDERSSHGKGFLADLCHQWETEARIAESVGVRTVVFRLGVVLGRGGGALEKLRGLFNVGLGGPVGTGQQYLSWVHIDDVVEIFVQALEDTRYAGIINVTAPAPVTNRDFAKEFGEALGRPSWFPAPVLGLKLVLGQAASSVLEGQRVLPRRTEALGFRFRYSRVASALQNLVASDNTVRIEPHRGPVLSSGAVAPRYVLTYITRLEAPLDTVFQFFSNAYNLGLITPDWLDFGIKAGAPEDVQEGDRIRYTIKLGPLPMPWESIILKWEPQRRFVDNQVKGPYHLWWHEHRFTPEGEHTVMEDRVYYTLPLGVIGRLVHRLFVARMLRRIFSYRGEAIARRFATRRVLSQEVA